MTLTQQLRDATNAAHARIEDSPLARAMADGTLDRDQYVQLLGRLLAAHRGWEPEAMSSPAAAPVWSADMARTEVIERDLAALGADPDEADHPAVRVWLASLRERAGLHPEVWLGVVYLFEGSRMGSLFLARSVAQALGVPPVPGHGLDYHLDGAAGRGPKWARFKAALDAQPLSPEQQRAAVWGAAATFQMLHELYAAQPQVEGSR